MKSFPVKLLNSAIDDIEQIALFVADRSQSLKTALDFTDRIELQCQKIGDAPYGGVRKESLGKGLRMVPFEKSAVIFYKIEDETVWIINVFYGGRDYDALMQDS